MSIFDVLGFIVGGVFIGFVFGGFVGVVGGGILGFIGGRKGVVFSVVCKV